MADYSGAYEGTQFEKGIHRGGIVNNSADIDALRKEIEALRAEVKVLKGIKKYKVSVECVKTYYFEGTDEEDVLQQFTVSNAEPFNVDNRSPRIQEVL